MMDLSNIKRYENIKIDFELTGTGWMQIKFITDDWNVEIPRGYLGGDLIAVMDELYMLYDIGNLNQTIEFDDEPNRSSITITNVDMLKLEEERKNYVGGYTVSWDHDFDVIIDLVTDEGDENEKNHSFMMHVSNFARAVIIAVDKMLDRHGFIGYADSWASGRKFNICSYLFAKQVALGKWKENYEGLENCTYITNFKEEMDIINMRLE